MCSVQTIRFLLLDGETKHEVVFFGNESLTFDTHYPHTAAGLRYQAPSKSSCRSVCASASIGVCVFACCKTERVCTQQHAQRRLITSHLLPLFPSVCTFIVFICLLLCLRNQTFNLFRCLVLTMIAFPLHPVYCM